MFSNFNLSNLVSSVASLKVLNLSFKISLLLFSFWYSLFIEVISLTIRAISIFSKLSLISKYFLATLLCSSRGFTVFSSSFITKSSLVKFSSVFSNFFKLSSLRFLYFKTPAALSNITLLSLALPLTISVTLPWEIILKALAPAPLSINRSLISLRRTRELLM